MEPQPERLPSETMKESLGLQACNATRRRSGNVSQRLHSVLEQIALAHYPSFSDRQADVYPSNIQYAPSMTPQHPGFRHASQSHDLCYTGAVSPSSWNTMVFGSDFIHSGNCYDTARCSSMELFLPVAAAHRQQSLTDHTYKTDGLNECFYTQMSQNNTQTLRSSIGFADLAASHDAQCGQLQKCLPAQGPGTSRSLAQITSNSLAVKGKDKTSPIASSTLQKGRPKRALTAYNLFFKDFREQILADRQKDSRVSADNRGFKLDKRKRGCDSKMHHGVGFEEMGKIIGQKWKELDDQVRRMYELRAEAEKRRYSDELAEYRMNEKKKMEAKFASFQASLSEETKQRYFEGAN